MLLMILKMSAVTLLMVLLTIGVWLYFKNREMKTVHKYIIGIIFGAAAIISTHFGVDYGTMMLNVRDIAPLSAGLVFDPISGIVAGLIGGIERYIAGTFFDVGSYTRIACSISTCLAGILSAVFNKKLFKGKKPSPFYMFMIGAVMEVFHMYVVFITHRSDMTMAFYVVDTCAIPMIIFTGLGMAAISLIIYSLTGELRKSLERIKNKRYSISVKFQSWLFICTLGMFLITFFFSYSMQTRTSMQNAQKTMEVNSKDAIEAYNKTDENLQKMDDLIKKQAVIMASAVGEAVNTHGGVSSVTNEDLEKIRAEYELHEIDAINENGVVVHSSKAESVGFDLSSTEQSRPFLDILSGKIDSLAQDYKQTGRVASLSLMFTGVKSNGGMVQIALDDKNVKKLVGVVNFNSVFGGRHVGENGSIYIVVNDEMIISERNSGMTFKEMGVPENLKFDKVVFFNATMNGKEMYCRYEKLDDGVGILATMPEEEIYRMRKTSAYETAFADILLFSLIFILIYILVQIIIVNNLDKINKSLDKITHGNLNEVVDVTNSTEFASLSNDINVTVDALKGYIEQAEKRIEEELEFAKAIQSAALPKVFKFPGRDEFELYASMNPAKEVGGDFYDFFFVGKNKIAFVIADVSGKGIPASLFMMRSKTAIKSLAETGASPATIFKKANNVLAEGNDACMFVTVWIGILDIETGKMQCANAGHEYPAIKRAGGKFKLFRDEHDSMLALMEDMPFREYEITLKPGDTFFLYTDGIPEAINSDKVQYGTNRMISALNESLDKDVQDITSSVMNNIKSFVGEAEQFDDITMLCLRFNKTTNAEEEGDKV